MAKKNEKKSFWRIFTGVDRTKEQAKSANKTTKQAKNTAKKASNSVNSKDSVKPNTKNIGGTQYAVSKTAKSGTLRPASTAKPKTNNTEPGYTAKSGSVLPKSNAQRRYTKGAAQRTIENAVVSNWKKKESQDNIQKKDANGNALRTKPDKNQSHTQTMQSNSEAWARLERQKRDYLNNKSTGLFGNKSGEEKEKALENARNSSKVKNIEEKQKKLHEANIKLAKKGDYAYNPDSGEWKYYSGNPVYTSKVLPNQTEIEQIEATDQSIGEDGVKPKYSAGERVLAGAKSIEKKLWNSGYSVADTAWQAAKNLGQSFVTDGWAKAKAREVALGQQLNIRGLPAERRQEILQAYKEAKASADALAVKTPVDQTLPSQVGMRESRALANMASQGMSGVPKVATEATLSAAQMAPSIAANIALPGSGLALMAGQAASDKMSTLNQQGISPAESLVRGAISGGIEYGTEKVPLESITNVFRGTAGRGIRNTLKNVAKSGVENALQEGASYGLNYAADSAAGDPNARFNAAELGKQMAMGGLTGMLMTGAGSAFNRISGVGEPATENNWNRISKNAELTDNAYAQEKLPNTQNVRTQSAETQTYEPVTMAQVRAIADNPQEVARLNHQGANIHGTKTEQRAQIQAFLESSLQAQQADMSMRQAETTNAAVPNNTTARPRNKRNQALVGNQFETLQDNPIAYSRFVNSAEGTPEQNLAILQRLKAKIQNDLQTADSSRAPSLRSSLREINAEISQLQETVKNRRALGAAQGRNELNPESRTIAAESGVFGRDTLSDDAVAIGNQAIQTGNPRQAINDMQQSYQATYEQAVQNATEYISSYQKQGVAILQNDDGTGVRASQNEPWYSDFYRRNGHAPRKSDYPVIAEQLVQQDVNGSMFGFSRQEYTQLLALNELQERVNDRDGLSGFTKTANGDVVALYDTPTTQRTRPNDNIAPALAAAGGRLPTSQTVQGVGNAYVNPATQQYQNNLTGNTTQNAILNAGGKLPNWDTLLRAQDTPAENPVIASKSNQPIVQENPVQAIQNPIVQQAVQETVRNSVQDTNPQNAPVSPDSSVGAAKSGFDPYTKAANEYGTIEAGERPARDVDVPKQMNDDTSVNRFARTVMEAEVTPDEMVGYLQEAVANGMFNGINRKNKSEVQSAMRYLEQNGIEAGLAAWNQKMASNGKVTTDDVVRAMLIMQRAAKDGDYQTATKLAAEISVEMRAAGQMSQSARILKMYGNTPEADVMSLQRAIQKINDDFSSQLQKQRYKAEKKAQRKGQTFDDTKFDGLKLSDEQMRRIMEATDENERQKVVEQVGAELADQLPVGLWDKWNSWRFFCMLQKPATHVRNIFGNVLNYAVNVKSKNAIGAVMELALPKEQRTKSIGPVGKEISDFVKQDFKEMEGVIRGDVKYDLGQSILSQRPAFGNSNNIIVKGLNNASQFVGDALEFQDAKALGWNYRDALGHYMKARGLKVSDMTGDTLEAARTYAIKEAQEATFRDPSQLATELSRIERNHLWGKVFIGSQMPFKKTPINIAKRGIEYSPASMVKAASDAAKLVQQKRSGIVDGSIQASDVINDIAKATTGSALMGVGFLLAGKGFLTGADAENRKEDMLNSAMGEQSYALKIGDYTYTLDWAAPAVMPLFAGVELYNVTHKKYGDDVKVADAVLQALCNLTAPLFEMSCMQGISNDIQTIAYGGGSDGEKAMAVAWNTFADYIGQGVPNILPGLQKTFDDTRRSSSSPDPITGLTNVDKFLRRQQAKIPWVAENGIPGTRVTGLQPYQDVFGRETTDDNIVRRAFQNIVSPGYLKKITGGSVENELKDLYGRTQNTTVLPGKAGAFRVEGEDIKLTGKEQTAYTKAAGQGAYKTLESLFSTDTYKNMSDEDKVRAISDVYDYAKSVAKAGTNRGYNMSSTDKLAQQAAADGAPIGSYFALKALQAAQAAKLKDEGTEGAESLARRAMLNAVQNDTSLTDDQKNALYKDLVIPAYGNMKNGSNTAVKEYEELSGYISPAVYAALKDKNREIDTDSKYANEDGTNVKNAAGLKQGDWEKYLANAGLTPAARAAVSDKIKFFQQIPATAKATNFSDAATYGMGSKTAQKYAAQAEQAGLSWDTYQDVAQYKNSLKGTGDGQKDKVISYINKITTDPAQRAVLRKLMNYK